ncbi:unnamed protein product, partial [Brassica oleracea]
ERSVSNAYNVSDVSVNPENMAEVQAFIRLLPKDDLKLSIVDSKPLALANGVSEKDDFFVHTPRKTIAEVLESKQGSENMLSGTFSTQSDAPEGSLMIQGGSSGSTDLTPAKRTRTPIINLEEAFDQNSVTKMACTIKVKKKKFEK